RQQKTKTYNSWDSLVVTHLTTNQPVHSLCMAERTGCPVFYDLWSYVFGKWCLVVYIVGVNGHTRHELRSRVFTFETVSLWSGGSPFQAVMWPTAPLSASISEKIDGRMAIGMKSGDGGGGGGGMARRVYLVIKP
ncbi:hypothetical protein K452DRAFT_219334, partial [Aplosporella prunicola CBS 121167]